MNTVGRCSIIVQYGAINELTVVLPLNILKHTSQRSWS